MTQETKPQRPFTVMVRFTVDPSDKEELMEMVTMMLMEIGPFMASQQGFLGFRSHQSLDGSTVVNYLQWQSQDDHERCMSSPEMESAGDGLMEWVESGRAKLGVETFHMISTIEG